MNAQCNAANQKLAALKGWTNLFVAGTALLGCPPNGAPNSRGQAAVPDWCGDWNACGELMVEHQTFPKLSLLHRGLISVLRGGKPIGQLAVDGFPSPAHAIRTAVVYAVIMLLQQRATTAAGRSAR
jgi:hypothetical protein